MSELLVLSNGRLFRYQGLGAADQVNNVALEASWLEQEFADVVGAKFAMATNYNSCGSAICMFFALKAAGVRKGDPVLVNTFTLHPVPSAIIHAGARPVFVESLTSSGWGGAAQWMAWFGGCMQFESAHPHNQ